MSNPSEQELNNPGDMLCVTVADGKYTVRQDASGRLTALRHGEPWRDCVGDGLVHALACEVDKLRGLLKRCLPIVHHDACMMADITRHAPLDAASQAVHDSTEFESERLMRDIPAALGLHTREALKVVLTAPPQPPAAVPERPQPPPVTGSPIWSKLRKLDANLDRFIRTQDPGTKSPLALAVAESLREFIAGILEAERKNIGEFGEPGDIGVANALERAVDDFLSKLPEKLLMTLEEFFADKSSPLGVPADCVCCGAKDQTGRCAQIPVCLPCYQSGRLRSWFEQGLARRVALHLADGLDDLLKEIRPVYAPDRYDYDLRKLVTEHALKDAPAPQVALAVDKL